ncbi:MAG: cytochrome C oxidase subunit IV family protein [Chromatiaceae bacterium]|nr:cytochrome C oxidase subunit IV family protein [Gammaproteobacteria bacterium]MCP5319177.1 cytochrome C oxidase subunit IV family protein [Chromatiaceae bacterium]MCP5435100.1 cytochrome C oxidase subunit IV family protein [Chromatiaceae bacterium]HOP16928.1 cytochrome C oxidase subunit IV family protein [Gammaproteobacteria bacterium]HPQ25795.1 cytochrome C oxidase subunit IV family protein [Gammaproteobacteria bacterium]
MNTTEPTRQLIRPCTLVYAVLMLLTLVTWGIGRAGLSGLGVSLLVLAFAMLKGQLIGDWFMGLRGVRGIWRWVVVIWLLIPGGLISLAFILSYRG